MYTITIIGGGFAGIQAAKRAARRMPEASITLIDANPYATMVPALPDVLSGRFADDALVRPLDEVVGNRCTVVTDRVTSVDLDDRSVHGERGTYPYDSLVIAAGSEVAPAPWNTAALPAWTVASLGQADALRDEIERRLGEQEQITVVIAGAGYTGLETAVALREGVSRERCRIVVVDPAPGVLPMTNDAERERLIAWIEKREVELKLETTVASVASDELTLSDGERISHPIAVWAGGMRANGLTVTPEPTGRIRDGRLEMSDQLQLPDRPEVFVAGDVAALSSNESILRRAVNFAFYSGRTAGENAARLLRGEKLRTFSPVDLGWIIPLSGESTGRLFGAIRVGGRLGTRLHYLMCGFRHFGARQAWQFYLTALNLKRRTRPLEARHPTGVSPVA